MAVKLNPYAGRFTFDGPTGNITALGTLTGTAAASGARSLRWMTALIQGLDAGFRSAVNAFNAASIINTGTTSGTVPVLAAGGKLAIARMPAREPASKINSGQFTPAQIPKMFAGEVRSGARKITGPVVAQRLYDLTANPALGLPAIKIRSGTLNSSQLPAGYTRTTRATSVAGGVRRADALQDESGNPVGLTDPFASQVIYLDARRAPLEVWQVRGDPNTGGVMRVQVQARLELPSRVGNPAFCGSDGQVGGAGGSPTGGSSLSSQIAGQLADALEGLLASGEELPDLPEAVRTALGDIKGPLGLCGQGLTNSTGTTSSTGPCGSTAGGDDACAACNDGTTSSSNPHG